MKMLTSDNVIELEEMITWVQAFVPLNVLRVADIDLEFF